MDPRTDAEDITRYGYQQELHRSLSFGDLLVYGLVFMVPIAPFGIFGGVFQGSGGMVALAYAIGMVAMMFTALSYAQMSRAFPMAGSVYTYAGRGIAAPVGFLSGWMILLDYVLVPGLLYLIAGVAMHSLVPAVPVWLWLVGFVVLNTVVNYMGIEMTAKVNKVMLAGELVVLAIFIVIGVVALSQGKGRGFDLTPLYNPDTFSLSLVFGAVSIAVLSFLGFDGISMLAEENKESARAIGRSMVAALLLAGVLFIVQTWVASLLVPDPAGLISKGTPPAPRSTTRPRSRRVHGWQSSPRWRPRSPGASPTRWSRRRRPPGCSTRWPATGSSRRSWPRSTRRRASRSTPPC